MIATGQKIGEGFDFPRLDVLRLAVLVYFGGRMEQYIGRLNRDYEGKEDAWDNLMRIKNNQVAAELLEIALGITGVKIGNCETQI